MAKERIHWIDWSKGVLIYFVVVAHYGRISPVVDNLICAFHMPAFFMISGYLHKTNTLPVSFVKNFRRLIIPGILFSLLCWLCSSAIMFVRHIPFSMDEYVVRPLLGIIRYDRPNVAPPCGVVWFLQVLFLCKLCLDWLQRYGLKAILAGSLLCAIATGLWYDFDIDDKCYIFFIQRTCASLPFVALGFAAKEYRLIDRLYLRSWIPWVLLILYVGGVAYNGRMGIFSWHFGHNVLIYYMVAFTGCLCFFLSFSKIRTGGVRH